MNKQNFLFFAVFTFASLFAGFDFADQASVVQVKSGARLYIGDNGQTITGTLKHDTGSTIDGTALTFTDGVVNRDGKTATLTGTYDADGGPSFLLQGSGRLEAGRNFTVDTVTVSGASNALAGTPILSNPVVLPTNTNLICDISAPLNNLITIDGGTVTLNSDLTCANNMALNGTGTIELSGNRYALAGYYESALSSTLTYNNAVNLELQGKLPLSGDWTFTGTNILDGKGATFDLRSGGTITIASGSRLVLRDALLKGVSQTNLIFTDTTSILELDRSQLDLTTSMTTDAGKIEVTGDSTFVMKDKDWIIKDNGKLTIDASILSLNVLGTDEELKPGTVKAPDAVYKERVKQTAAIASNITNGTLALTNGGVIAEIGERLDEELLGGGVAGALSLDKSTLMSPDDVIRITANSTIDGRGSRILFARPGNAQLIVDAGVKLTLKNVELHGLIDTTLFLGDGAELDIGEGVIFSLADDVTWNNEKIKVTGDNTVFELRSIGGPRVFQLKSTPVAGSTAGTETYIKHLDLTTNSLSLHNVFFRGLDHVTTTTAVVGGVTKTGSIVLSGDARVDIDATVSSVAEETFVVHGLNNRLRLRSGDLTLSGGIRFDATTTSALHLEFVLPSTFHGTPRLSVDSGGIDVSSSAGHAYLISDTHSIRLENNASDSFILGVNGFIAGKKIEVLGNPIQQTSSKAVLLPGLELKSSLAAGAIASSTTLLDAMRSFSGFGKPKTITSFELQQRERIQGLCLTRALQLPNEDIKPVVHYDSPVALAELAGNIMLRSDQGARYTNWRMSATRDVNLTMYDGIEMVQAGSSTTVKAADIVNISGGTTKYPNTMHITNDLTIEGKMLLDDDSVLQVRAEPDGTPPVITFGLNSVLEFGARSTLILSGQGSVIVPANFILDFAASNGTLLIQDGMQLLLSSAEQVTVKGKGTLQLKNGGQVVVDYGSSMRFGAAYTDDITLRVMTGGSMRVGNAYPDEIDWTSFVSFVMGYSTIDFSQGGTLTLAVGGVFECNTLQLLSLPGATRKIDFSSGGLLSVGTNSVFYLSDNLATRSGITISLHGGQVSGAGDIGVPGSSFIGVAQNNIISAINQTAAQIVGALVQTVSTLPHAIVFVNSAGKTVVRTKNDAIVVLGSNETILSETSAGKITGFKKFTNQYFYLDADGNRTGAS